MEFNLEYSMQATFGWLGKEGRGSKYKEPTVQKRIIWVKKTWNSN